MVVRDGDGFGDEGGVGYGGCLFCYLFVGLVLVVIVGVDCDECVGG